MVPNLAAIGLLAEFGAVDPHRVAGFHIKRAGAPARAGAAHNSSSATVATSSPGRMTVPAVTGTVSTRPAVGASTLAFGDLLLDDRTLGGARLQRIGRDVKGGVRLVEAGLRNGAARKQILGAGEIGLGLRNLRLEAGDLGVERLHLQGQLLVADGRDHLALLDLVAVLDARARRPCRRSGRGPARHWCFRRWRTPPFRRPPSWARRRRFAVRSPAVRTGRQWRQR